MTTFLLLAALAVGYLLGRWQPWTRLGDWADWQIRIHPDRWIGRGWRREALLYAALLSTQPARALRAWRTRNDPTPPRSPAIRVTDHTTEETR
ncbi:hypothetical protein QNO07_09550 [Streptomyces sp. 549]|uniref:hypothetical protein n=1 Tax=Streptomyces sp. 549 TaxID=3049076 RepID=UPI0024C3BF03|nr:hypothetical protein [Streptomyces sp. 549]MDK1473664.1 hypothetical protein [Streptomyces sp. 549]